MLALVGTRWNRRPLRHSHAGPQEGGDGPRALVLVGGRGHRQPGIVGEQRDDPVDVVGRERFGETSADPPLVCRARRRRCASSARAPMLLDGRPGALQGAFDGGLGRVQHRGDLGGGVPSTSRRIRLAAWRGGISCSHSTNASSTVSLIWSGPPGPGELSVRCSSKVSGYGCSQVGSPCRVGCGGSKGGTGTGGGRRPASRRALRQRLVAIGTAMPATTTCPRTREATPCRQHRLLQHVLRIVQRAQDPIAVQVQLVTVRIGEVAKRLSIAGSGTAKGRLTHRRILSPCQRRAKGSERSLPD